MVKPHQHNDNASHEHNSCCSGNAPEGQTSGQGCCCNSSPETAQGSNDSLAALQAQLAELTNKHTEVSDAYLRAKAEVENVRKRAQEEETKARKFAIESFASALLPVKDSLEAALDTPNQTFDGLKEGVETILKQLTTVFERNKLQEISPVVGEKLDPHIHEAIAVVPADQEPNTIVNVMQKGYKIADRTLRAAMVVVAAQK